MSSTTTCSNCNNAFSGAFCNECGQKITHRLTMGHLAHDVIHAFTHTDKGFFHLLLQLFYKPGIVAREYIIEGKRKRYFLPFQYLVIISAIATFVAANSHFFEITSQTVYGNIGSEQATATQKAFMMQASQLQSKYHNIIILVQLPFFALGTYWIFKKQKLYFAEHLTLQTFLIAQTAVFGMIMMLLITLFKWNTGFMMVSMTIISIFYQLMAYLQFFEKPPGWTLFKGLMSYLLGLLLFVIFLLIVMFVVLLVMKVNKPG